VAVKNKAFLLTSNLIFAFCLTAQSNTTISVQLFNLFQPGSLEVTTEKPVVLEIQNRLHHSQQILLPGQRLLIELTQGILKTTIQEHNKNLIFEGKGESVKGESSLYTLGIPGRIERSFLGNLLVTPSWNQLLPRILVDEEIATEQILRSEMTECRQLEALKAQAILIRSYLRFSHGRHQKDGYDFCDTTHCQFLTGFVRNADQFHEGVKKTGGILIVFRGQLFQPAYTAACGGKTLPQPDAIPYAYPSVLCRYCVNHFLYKWKTTLSKNEFVELALNNIPESKRAEFLMKLSQEEDTSPEAQDLKRKVRILVGRTLGWNLIRSDRFKIRSESNTLEIEGHGSGHNLGLCQAGAIELAKEGKLYSEILAFYFPGCDLTGKTGTNL
jgi:stage II sporulation protein D